MSIWFCVELTRKYPNAGFISLNLLLGVTNRYSFANNKGVPNPVA